MIHTLRIRHRIAAGLMAAGLPLLVIAALSMREPIAVATRLPVPLAPPPAVTGNPLAEIEAIGNLPLRGALYRSEDLLLLHVWPEGPVVLPDLLLYWSPEPVRKADGLPASAYLLGPAGGSARRAYPLPVAARMQGGYLVAYSLAHQEVVTSTPCAAPSPPDVRSTP